MERITRAQLEARVGNLNRRLKSHGSKYHYALKARNGYIGLDRYFSGPAGLPLMASTVMTGTMREVADFLHAGMVVLDDVELGRYMDLQRNLDHSRLVVA